MTELTTAADPLADGGVLGGEFGGDTAAVVLTLGEFGADITRFEVRLLVLEPVPSAILGPWQKIQWRT